MPKAERSASVVWQGKLADGSGRVRLASGALDEFPVTWASRVESSDGRTSPEELLAAAHAACFSMALSHALTGKGHPPAELHVAATCTIEKLDAGFTITSMRLRVEGDVPGITEAGFQEAANGAKAGCPVSRALQGNVDVSLEAALRV